MPLRFETDYDGSDIVWDPLVDEVFDELTSSFLEMPKGEGFIEYSTFETGYQTLKRCTDAFANVTAAAVRAAARETPVSLIVFRCILGLTPPEWAHLTRELTGLEIGQGAARAMDRRIRLKPLTPLRTVNSVPNQRMDALIEAGVQMLAQGIGVVTPGILHRLDKADTKEGIASLQPVADLGVPYPVLLYERFLGLPFQTHRNSVSELRGKVVELAVKNVLDEAKVSFRETKRAERIAGFDQAPDFIVPDEFNPVAVIEAKLAEDDGTARDKVSRVQNLRRLRESAGLSYDVIACVAGRGFKVRREDMRRLLQATEGKVFTLSSMHLLIEHTRIREYRVR
jgi:hypothetical protein